MKSGVPAIAVATRVSLVLGCGLQLWSQDLPVVNAGFEADSITPGAFVVLQPQAWTLYDPSGMIDNANNAVGVIRPLPGAEYFPAGTPQGDNAALVYLAGPQTGEAGLQQTLAATLQPDTRYRCSVQVGNIASGTSLPGSSGGAGTFYNLLGFPGYRIDVLAGTNVVASDLNSIGETIPEGEFRPARFHFDTGSAPAHAGLPLGIRLVNLKTPGSAETPNVEVDFDEVLLSAGPIPVAAELGIGLLEDQAYLTLHGTTGATYRIQYADSITATTWSTWTNLYLNVSPQPVVGDAVLAAPAVRFYRAVLVD